MNKKAVITLSAIGVGLYLLRNNQAGGEETPPESGGGGGGGGGFLDPLAPVDPNDPGSGVPNTPGGGADTPAGDYTGPDSDGDGVPDVYDVFPNDPSRTGYEQQSTGPVDSDGDGVQDAYDPFPNDAGKGAEVYDASATSYSEPSITSKLADSLIYGAPFIAIPAAVGAYKGIKTLATGRKLLDFTPKVTSEGLSTRIPRSNIRSALREVPRGRVPSGPSRIVTTARSGRATVLPSRAGSAARTAARVEGTVARVRTAPRLTAATLRTASVESRIAAASPATRALSRVAPRLAAAITTPAAQTAGRVAGRAATVATVVTGGYVAARNAYDTGRAATVLWDNNRTQADIDRAKALSGGAVARGTEFLSLGLVSINPNSGTRILNQNFSYATGSNFVAGLKKLKFW